MGTVIGYKGTTKDRTVNWRTMLMVKESYELFRNSNKKREKEIAEMDRGVYTEFLSDYVKAA